MSLKPLRFLPLLPLVLAACAAPIGTPTAAKVSNNLRIHPELLGAAPAKAGTPATGKDALRQLRSLYFAPGSSEVPAEASVTLAQHARYLNATPQARIQVIGYADDGKNPEASLLLAKTRGEMVQRELANIGVAKERITLAPPKVLTLESGDKSWPGNRRVDLMYD